MLMVKKERQLQQLSLLCNKVKLKQIINNNTNNNRLMVWDNPGRQVPEETHPLTPILIVGHPLSSSSIYNDQWHPLCSFYVLDSPLVQPLSREIQNTRKNIPHVPLCGGNNNKLQPSQSQQLSDNKLTPAIKSVKLANCIHQTDQKV